MFTISCWRWRFNETIKINGEVLDMKNPQYVADRINDYLNNNQSFDKKNKMLLSYNEYFNNFISKIEKL